MEIIAHRRNTVALLQATPTVCGVEVDIRSYGNDLIINHDPYLPGESFEDWLNNYRHGTLILNVKEEGLEDRLISLMKAKKIENYFFLDQSFPFLIKWAIVGLRNCAVRVSEYESIDTALSLAGKIDWIWLDCFTKFPIDHEGAAVLKRNGFKLCLVSPELQGRNSDNEIIEMRNFIQSNSILIDAVCTKRLDLWA
jgi:hypothetical protein